MDVLTAYKEAWGLMADAKFYLLFEELHFISTGCSKFVCLYTIIAQSIFALGFSVIVAEVLT